MFDSIFKKSFKSSKCKTLLKLAESRIKLLKNKRGIQIKQLRRDVAQLISSRQEASARIRVEQVFREENMMAAYEMIELYCELVVVRLSIVSSQKQIPMDLREAIASLIFAAPRCADLPELLEIRSLFAIKYGKEFVASATELRPDCGVNRRIVEKLSVRTPSGEVRLKLLKEIAAEHNIVWDSTASEAELLKLPEDILEGPAGFVGASQLPISSSSLKGDSNSSDSKLLNEASFNRTQSLPPAHSLNSSNRPEKQFNSTNGGSFLHRKDSRMDGYVGSEHPNDKFDEQEGMGRGGINNNRKETFEGKIMYTKGRSNGDDYNNDSLSSSNRPEKQYMSTNGGSFQYRKDSRMDANVGLEHPSNKFDKRTGMGGGINNNSNKKAFEGSCEEEMMYAKGRSNGDDYNDIASAVKAAAESAERAAAAARAAIAMSGYAPPAQSQFTLKNSNAKNRNFTKKLPLENPRVDSHSDNDDDDEEYRENSASSKGMNGKNNSTRRVKQFGNGNAKSEADDAPLFDDDDDDDEYRENSASSKGMNGINNSTRRVKQFGNGNAKSEADDAPLFDEYPPKHEKYNEYRTASFCKGRREGNESVHYPGCDKEEDSNSLENGLSAKHNSHIPIFDDEESYGDNRSRSSSLSSQPPQRRPPNIPAYCSTHEESFTEGDEETTADSAKVQQKQHPPDYDDLAARFEALRSRRWG